MRTVGLRPIMAQRRSVILIDTWPARFAAAGLPPKAIQ
jgi:hypothetical protein